MPAGSPGLDEVLGSFPSFRLAGGADGGEAVVLGIEGGAAPASRSHEKALCAVSGMTVDLVAASGGTWFSDGFWESGRTA